MSPADTVFPLSSNLYYDIFAATRAGGTWSANRRVTDASSLTDYVFVGDYNDTATSGNLVYGVWTDRRDRTSIFQSVDHVYGAPIR